MAETWMVRAGQGSRYFENFRDEKIVAIGWKAVGELKQFQTRKKLAERVKAVYPDYTEQMAMVAAGQLYRFANEIKIGDRIVTYDGRARSYLCGLVVGECVHEPNQEIEGLTNRREVRWDTERSRDDLSEPAQNSLGAILTLFQVTPAISAELWQESNPKQASSPNAHTSKDTHLVDAIARELPLTLHDASYAQIAEQAAEKIKDRIAALTWDQMQELVAGLLRGMGYVTQVSPPGSDRSRDVVASPDGFGFQQPRIVVEVKHRPRERMGAPELRTFIGGRKPHENGLYVSTGGFTKEAYYEAERATIPLTLLDFEQLVAAVLASYTKFDERTKQLLPLVPIYWPL
jgi:restriction system protein